MLGLARFHFTDHYVLAKNPISNGVKLAWLFCLIDGSNPCAGFFLMYLEPGRVDISFSTYPPQAGVLVFQERIE